MKVSSTITDTDDLKVDLKQVRALKLSLVTVSVLCIDYGCGPLACDESNGSDVLMLDFYGYYISIIPLK